MKVLAIAMVLLVWWAIDRHDTIQRDRIAQLDAMQTCRPEHDGEIAAMAMHDGQIECAITGRNHGRRAVIERTPM